MVVVHRFGAQVSAPGAQHPLGLEPEVSVPAAEPAVEPAVEPASVLGKRKLDDTAPSAAPPAVTFPRGFIQWYIRCNRPNLEFETQLSLPMGANLSRQKFYAEMMIVARKNLDQLPLEEQQRLRQQFAATHPVTHPVPKTAPAPVVVSSDESTSSASTTEDDYFDPIDENEKGDVIKQKIFDRLEAMWREIRVLSRDAKRIKVRQITLTNEITELLEGKAAKKSKDK